ncbi:Aste57867_1743 [Aphanomyces stellatus]|uniref:Aste57867_1743 protein n=1 Tax=Aphanomyces stellatus TaxID=120398 RepID=A0A485K6F4_9STRA|nr:hypothetical protein As57867_001741 [Aphanomyces stellatus]VFT78953.1 Aste57867_1743 [Aphanomyces stellatus]
MAAQDNRESWDFDEGVRLFLGEDCDPPDNEANQEPQRTHPETNQPTQPLSSSDANRAPRSAKKPVAWKRGRIPTHLKQRLELEALQEELTRLQGQICEIRVCPTRKMSIWERMATNERAELVKATSDNNELRGAVASNAQFIDEMEALLRKKRRLVTTSSVADWEAFVLPATAPDRNRAIHWILDREINRIKHVCLRSGLPPIGGSAFDDDVHRAVLVPQATGNVYFEVVERVTLAAPFRDVSAAAWSVVTGVETSMDNSVQQSFEKIDDRTMYIHACDRRHHTPCHAHLLSKYHKSLTRDVIVLRSVLGDPLWTTHADGDLVEDVTAWNEIAPLPGHEADACVLTIVWRINLGRLASSTTDELDDISALFASASIAQRPPVQGSISPHAMAQHLASPAAPHVVTLGNLHIYLARSKSIEEPFRRAVIDVIERHKQEREGMAFVK